MALWLETLALLIVLSYLLYKWSTRKYGIFIERGVPHEKPTPLLGNIELRLLFGRVSAYRESIEKYLEYKHHKVYGVFLLTEPIFIVYDLDMIKKIGIKDFDHFVNHKAGNLNEQDEVLGKHLLALRGQQWKEMRNILTPTFTGSKMRLMHDLINECSLEGMKYLMDEIQRQSRKDKDDDSIELEMKDYFTRYANDVIATVAFGIKVNSFEDQSNRFYRTGKRMTEPNAKQILKSIVLAIAPKVMKLLRISVADQEILKYFHDLVFDAIEYRQDNHIVRPDMIELLLKAKENFENSKTGGEGAGAGSEEHHATFDDEDLLAQCLIFFLAGFETVSTSLCFTLYELAMNREIQDQLHEEIIDNEETDLNYDSLMKMDYLNMIVMESLRKWPPATITDRIANDDYKLYDNDGRLIVELKKDDQIIVPIYGLHYDPEYFPDPERFQPERFAKANEHLIRPNSYLPFGIGPRSCIGNRLALMEIKSILYHLIKNFEFAPTERTPVDMIDAIKGFQRMPKEKFPLKIKRREGFKTK